MSRQKASSGAILIAFSISATIAFLIWSLHTPWYYQALPHLSACKNGFNVHEVPKDFNHKAQLKYGAYILRLMETDPEQIKTSQCRCARALIKSKPRLLHRVDHICKAIERL